MTIEQEIKQTKFKTAWQKAAINLKYTSNQLKWQQANFYKTYDINDQHYNILRILRGQYPGCTNPTYIKEVLLDKRGDLTRLLDKLDKMGLVAREINPECRRMMNISITEKGLSLLSKLDVVIEQLELQMNKMDEGDLRLLSNLLDKFRLGFPSN